MSPELALEQGTALATLAALFLSGLLSATLLPGNSEIALFAALSAFPELATNAVLVVTLGNTLGGMSTYLLARLLPERTRFSHLAWLHRHGSAALLMAWLPIVGDGLCAAAGWLRLPWFACMLWMALGKALRYVLITLTVI